MKNNETDFGKTTKGLDKECNCCGNSSFCYESDEYKYVAREFNGLVYEFSKETYDDYETAKICARATRDYSETPTLARVAKMPDGMWGIYVRDRETGYI